MTTTTLLPIGTLVTILADTHGESAATGLIAGHLAFTDERGTVHQGYAVRLDRGFYDPTATMFVSMIVAHVESVDRLLPTFSPAVESFLDDVMPGIEGQ